MKNNLIVIDDFLNEEECDYLCDFLLNHEEEILNFKGVGTKNLNNSDWAREGPPSSKVSGILKKSWLYNVLDYKEVGDMLIPKFIKILKDEILDKFNIPKERIDVRGWGNILKHKEHIIPHTHSISGIYGHDSDTMEDRKFVCCNIFLGGPTDIGTQYKFNEYSSTVHYDNKVGTISFFSSMLQHSVLPNTHNTPRFSIAFDIMNDGKFTGGVDKRKPNLTFTRII